MECIDYSFKRSATVKIGVDGIGGDLYTLDISEISFSQTFQEHSYSVKTLQSPHMFEQSVINKANPASFEITIPALREEDLKILFDLSLSTASFNIYVETDALTFLISTSVITNANFIAEKTRPLSFGVTGEASEVEIFIGTPDEIPVARSSTRTYNRVSDLDIALEGTFDMTNALSNITLELQNDIEWNPYTSVHDAGIMSYPSAYTVKKKILAGTFTKYLLDTETADLFKWNKNASLHIFIGQAVGGTEYGFDLNMTNCSYTNRVGTGEVFTQSFDWRMTENPTQLSSIITYTTLP